MKIKYTIGVLVAALGCSMSHAGLVVDSTAAADVLIGQANKASFTQIIASTAARRGQTFTMADTGDANTAYNVSAITLQKSGGAGQTADLTYAGTGANLKLMVYEWDPAANANDSTSWATAGGSNTDPWNGSGMTEVHTQSFALDGLTLGLDDYMHFNFDTALTLEENKAYGFLVQYFKAGSATDNIVLQQGGGSSLYTGGDLLRADGGGTVSRTMTANTDLTFWVSGQVVPEPATFGILTAGSVLLLAVRRIFYI